MTGRLKPIYYRREFLNLPGVHAGAYVLATVRAESLHHYLSLADCERFIRLEFDLTNRRRARNAVRKADLLIDVLTGFRAALDEARVTSPPLH